MLVKERNYHKIEKVGEGTYGTVWRGTTSSLASDSNVARDLTTNTDVAIKKIALEEDGIPTTAMREVSILKDLNHGTIQLFNSADSKRISWRTTRIVPLLLP